MIDVETVRGWQFPVLRQTYGAKDAILYALALGYGSDPLDEEQLRYVFEEGLQVVPAFANVLCYPGFWISDPRTGIASGRAVHGEHRVQFHAPLRPAGTVRGETRVLDVVDKGAQKGALLVFERRLFDDASGALLARIEQHTLCRGDGGFSDKAHSSAARTPSPAQPQPAGPPDWVVEIRTLPQAALLYRLSADPNPLHASPQAARVAGFDRPILHGLCTFGVVCRAVLQACTEDAPGRLKSLAGRFSAPVIPGELLRTEIWGGAADGRLRPLQLRCVAPEREAVVFTAGTASIEQGSDTSRKGQG